MLGGSNASRTARLWSVWYPPEDAWRSIAVLPLGQLSQPQPGMPLMPTSLHKHFLVSFHIHIYIYVYINCLYLYTGFQVLDACVSAATRKTSSSRAPGPQAESDTQWVDVTDSGMSVWRLDNGDETIEVNIQTAEVFLGIVLNYLLHPLPSIFILSHMVTNFQVCIGFSRLKIVFPGTKTSQPCLAESLSTAPWWPIAIRGSGFDWSEGTITSSKYPSI